MLNKNLTKILTLNTINYFTVDDVAYLLGITKESASVFCSRYSKQGLLVKLKNNFYTTSLKLENISNKELKVIANIIQVPSYISLTTALAYYDVTTQVQHNYIESVSIKRTIEYDIKGNIFKYIKIKKKYYFGFSKINNIFIASKEKSFIDSVYLFSFGKYKPDFSSINFSKFDSKEIKKILKVYPEKTNKIVRKLCKI